MLKCKETLEFICRSPTCKMMFGLLYRRNGGITVEIGRAIAQAVSSRLPTAAARFRAQVRSCGICGGQSGTGAGFLRVLRFPLPILIPPITPHSLSTIRCW
jgi:hypothetical protein